MYKTESNYNYFILAPGISQTIIFERLSLELGLETSFKIRPRFITVHTVSDYEYDYYYEEDIYSSEEYEERYHSQLELAGGGILGVNYSIFKNFGIGFEYAPSISQRILTKSQTSLSTYFGSPDFREIEYSDRSTYIDHRLSLSFKASF
jgi:hypothetical protein